MNDQRNDIAKARDSYIESDEGRRCCEPTTFGASTHVRQYLQNRIEAPFIAGWNSAQGFANKPEGTQE